MPKTYPIPPDPHAGTSDDVEARGILRVTTAAANRTAAPKSPLPKGSRARTGTAVAGGAKVRGGRA